MSLSADLRSVILSSTPAGYWPLDDLGDLGRDDSVWSNHGSQSGTFTSSEYSIGDRVFTAVKATSGGIVTIPDSARYANAIVTLEMMIVLTEDANTVIAERGSGNNKWTLQAVGSAFGETPPSVQCIMGNSVKATAARSRIFKICHLIVTLNSGYTSVWVNGSKSMQPAGLSGSASQTSGSALVTLFSRLGGIATTSAALAHFAIYDRPLTDNEIDVRRSILGTQYVVRTLPTTTVWGNEQTPAELASPDPFFASVAPVQGGIRWLAGSITQPPQRDDYGYIDGKITRRGDVAPAHIVACFDSGFNLIDTVKSGIAGEYRFDNLPLHASYMIVAMDNAAYTYNPAAADRRTPRAYS